jgi:hypothetical protein
VTGDFFIANTTGQAENINNHLVYNTNTGLLSYDADGSGAGAAIQIVTLIGAPTLNYAYDSDYGIYWLMTGVPK